MRISVIKWSKRANIRTAHLDNYSLGMTSVARRL